MDKKYKEYMIRGLYGLIDGSPHLVEKMFKDYFTERFNNEFDEITVTSTNRVITKSDGIGSIGSWIGSMTAKLVVDGESFSFTRDFGEEYDIDKLHPDYESDLWFFESDKCCIGQKFKLAIEDLDKNEINENPYADSFHLDDSSKYSMSGRTLRYILNLLPDANKVPYAEIGEYSTNKICEIEEVYVVEVNDYDSHPICFVGSTKELCEDYINEYDGIFEKEDLVINVKKLNLG